MTDARSVVVESDGLRVRALVWGRDADPTVVLVHGNGAHGHWWEPLLPSFVPGWRAVPVHEHDRRIGVAPPDQCANAEPVGLDDHRAGVGHVQSASNAASARGTTDSYPSASMRGPRSSMSHQPG